MRKNSDVKVVIARSWSVKSLKIKVRSRSTRSRSDLDGVELEEGAAGE